jgi:hypothetical protein
MSFSRIMDRVESRFANAMSKGFKGIHGGGFGGGHIGGGMKKVAHSGLFGHENTTPANPTGLAAMGGAKDPTSKLSSSFPGGLGGNTKNGTIDKMQSPFGQLSGLGSFNNPVGEGLRTMWNTPSLGLAAFRSNHDGFGSYGRWWESQSVL